MPLNHSEIQRLQQGNAVFCQSILSILSHLPDQSIKLTFCDPPYNNNTIYSDYEDNLLPEDYKNWCETWFKECMRVSQRVIITPGHGNLWMWGTIEKPKGVGCWYKPGNSASSILGFNDWEPWLYYCTGNPILGGTDTIRAPVSKQKDVGDHPCPKPLSLLIALIKKTTKEGDTILDPFCGSGTTLVAAKRLKRRYIGCDISKKYIENCKYRLEQEIDIFD